MVMTAIIMLMPQMAMILMMFVNLDIVSKTSRCQSSEDVCYQYILFIIVTSKIHPRKNHNYYNVCMSTAFIKGRQNPVGFTDCSHTTSFFQLSTSPNLKELLTNQPVTKPERTSLPLVKP